MIYQILIDNVTSRIVPTPTDDILCLLDKELSFMVDGYFFSPLYKKHLWDGRIRLYKKRYSTFPTGLYSKVLSVFQTLNAEVETIDVRPQPVLGEPYKCELVLRDYQNEVVDTMLRCGRGTVKVATRGGKSYIITDFISKVNVPTLIIVPKLSLLAQFHRDLGQWLNTGIGKIGDGVCDPKRITIATMQSLVGAYGKRYRCRNHEDVVTHKTGKCSKCQSKLQEELTSEYNEERKEKIRYVVDSVETLIVDECHHLCADTLQFLGDKARSAYYRLGFSATPRHDTDDDILVELFTGKQIVDIGASALIEKGWLAKPTIEMYEVKHDKAVGEMGFDGKIKKVKYATIYEKEIVNSVKRNNLIIKLALEHVAKGNNVLIAVTRIEHGEFLEGMLKTFLNDKVLFASGEFGSEALLDILGRLDRKELMVVIATTVFGEGITVNSLNCLINSKSQASLVDTLQLAGRVLGKTETKDKVTIIDFLDTGSKFIDTHAKARLKIYKSEPGFEVKIIKEG